MPPLLDENEFTKLLRKSKQEPVNFTFGLGKGPEDHQLAFHLKKEGKPLFEMLKKEASGITKGTWGKATSDAKSITLNLDKDVPSLLKNLKLFLKINGLKLKPIIIGPDGTVLSDDAAGADDAALEQEANAALKRQLTAALKKLAPVVQKMLKAAPGRKAELMTPLAGAKKGLDDEDFDAARAAVKELVAAIKGKSGGSGEVDEDDLSDADDDVAKLLDPDVFTKLLRKSKREPVPFAFGLAKDPEQHALAFHRKKEGKPLFTMLKQQADGVAKGTWGMATSDAKTLTLTIEKEVPALYKNLKLFLKARGLKLKPIILNADGTEVPDDDAAPAAGAGAAANLLAVWNKVKDQVDERVVQLQDALRKTGDPDHRQIADLYTDGLNKDRVPLNIALQNYAAVGEADRETAKAKLAAALATYRTGIDSNFLIQRADDNPFKVKMGIGPMLSKALGAMEKSLDS